MKNQCRIVAFVFWHCISVCSTRAGICSKPVPRRYVHSKPHYIEDYFQIRGRLPGPR